MTPQERAYEEGKALQVALTREGLVSKDTYDWYKGHYVPKLKRIAKQSRQE